MGFIKDALIGILIYEGLKCIARTKGHKASLKSKQIGPGGKRFKGPPKHIHPGLSVLPKDLIPASWFVEPSQELSPGHYYSCNNCGFTVHPAEKVKLQCKNCGTECWVKSDLSSTITE